MNLPHIQTFVRFCFHPSHEQEKAVSWDDASTHSATRDEDTPHRRRKLSESLHRSVVYLQIQSLFFFW